MENELKKLREFISRKFPAYSSRPGIMSALEADYLQAVGCHEKYGHPAGSYAVESTVRIFLGYKPRR